MAEGQPEVGDGRKDLGHQGGTRMRTLAFGICCFLGVGQFRC